MNNRLQRKFIKSLLNDNKKDIQSLLSHKEFALNDPSLTSWFSIPDYAEPIYSFIAYSIINIKNNDDLEFYEKNFKYLCSLDINSLKKSSVSNNKPLINNKIREVYTPLSYSQKLYSILTKNNRILNPYQKKMFSIITENLIQNSYNEKSDRQHNPLLISLKGNSHLLSIFIKHHFKNDILFPLSFYDDLFSMYTNKKNKNLSLINNIKKEKEHFFSDKFINKSIKYYTNFYFYNNFPVWIYQNYDKYYLIEKEETQDYLYTSLISIIPEYIKSHEEPLYDIKKDIEQIFSNVDFKKIINIPLKNQNKLKELYIKNNIGIDYDITLSDFIFKIVPHVFFSAEKLNELYSIYFKYNKNSLYNNITKDSPMEDLIKKIDFTLYSKHEYINLLSNFEETYKNNPYTGSNFWHYVRSTKDIEYLEPFIEKGCSLDCINNKGDHAFTEIVHFAILLKKTHLIDWCCNMLLTNKINNFEGQYNGISLFEIVKQNSSLINAFSKAKNIETDVDVELNISCHNLLISEVKSLIKLNPESINKINNNNESPLLTLLLSSTKTKHQQIKKNQIYNILKENNLNHDLLINNQNAINIYLDNYCKKPNSYNIEKDKFIRDVINNTKYKDYNIIAQYLYTSLYIQTYNNNFYNYKNIEKHFASNFINNECNKKILDNFINPDKNFHTTKNFSTLYTKLMSYFLSNFQQVLTLYNKNDIENLYHNFQNNCKIFKIPKDEEYRKNIETFFEKQMLENEINNSVKRSIKKRL